MAATTRTSDDGDDGETVLDQFDGATCPRCVVGDLRRGRFKGDGAVVRSACETPAIGLF
ncbi:hypothetical protein ACFQE1_19520 [Halobium palmae]|uniref:Uncharacterized protein n=1 Tax=Halobium palmae TaxID=1776492 RepID=A0ABD5S4Q5_9EURY